MLRSILMATVLAMSAWSAAAAPPAGELDVSKYAGKVVYVDFWASWCVPCRKSFPWLNALVKKYPDDLVVVGVNVDHERAAAMKFLEKYHADFPLVFDPDGKVAAAYKLEGMPSAVILGRDGKIVHRHVGFRAEKIPEYEATLRSLIGK
jgi:cytochrome c biogenesis protein CcmG/thiol:disulfide interchange protein DsbE